MRPPSNRQETGGTNPKRMSVDFGTPILQSGQSPVKSAVVALRVNGSIFGQFAVRSKKYIDFYFAE